MFKRTPFILLGSSILILFLAWSKPALYAQDKFNMLGFSSPQKEARKGLKVFISADIEGIAGVISSSQTAPTGEEYAKVKDWMSNEVLAAIEGAKAAGAVEFLVADSHGSMQNLLPEKFGLDTKLVRGWARPLGMMQGIDNSFDAVMFIGYHAQAGTRDAVLAHTITGTIYNLRVNGITQLEASLNALVAGYYGVPVIMISGDQAVAEEAIKLLGRIEVAVVKKGVAGSVITLSPQAACQLIREKAENAVMHLEDFKPFKIQPPYKFEIDFVSAAIAEVVSWIPEIRREGNRTVSYTDGDLLKIMPLLRIITRFINQGN